MTPVGIFSRGLRAVWTAPALLGLEWVWRPRNGQGLAAIACWGRKQTSRVATCFATNQGLPCWRLEDGFLRSFQPGTDFPPLSLVMDREGIYYDSTHPSDIESLLANEADLLAGEGAGATPARAALVAYRLSKYNAAADAASPHSSHASNRKNCTRNVLVVDQTVGDTSVALGGVDAGSFTAMLAAARAENPGATVYVKTHPEVSSGRKRGYLTHIQNDEPTVVLRAPVNPLSLIENMDRVYVVTSTMGFEALLAGKPVTCFGVPWYAGWGVTDDRVKDSPAWARRTRKRTVEELFAAAYIHYTRYLNPETHKRGTIMDVIGWLVRQKQMADRMHGASRKARVIGVGFRRWKAVNLKPLLGLHPEHVHFASSLKALNAMTPQPGDSLVVWGAQAPRGLADLASSKGARILHAEDGFIRSVGLGSDLIPPRSLVLDERGIYFDATRPSDLEHLLRETQFADEELAEARRVREFIVANGITKYNLEPLGSANWDMPPGRAVILVPGQVEDDASISLGCTTVRTNIGLLQAVRQAHPGAFIVYKPHPDVTSGNRKGRLELNKARVFADHVETQLGIVSCIDACQEVHTMTSLSGFDALLRGKKVVTYGQPFYAGWGLTDDRCIDGPALDRRTRVLSLDELVAGALLRYPIYWDPILKGYTTCMAVLRQIISERDALAESGKLARMHRGRLGRITRKASTLIRSWTSPQSH